ncbi:hypothetical protein D7X48_11190 [bacterium D16-50]|nr:hypothetical protein D7X48_11190 [bacterium D16-50]
MGDLKGFTMGRFRQGSIFRHVAAVTERVIFIGFTAQIGLGAVWMCINFDKVQDFGWGNLGRTEPEGVIYTLYSFLGGIPQLLYLAQLAFALFAGYRFLSAAGRLPARSGRPFGQKPAFYFWGSLCLLTFPFAMQCHLAVLPYSAMGSLFLLMLSFLLEAVFGGGGKKALGRMRMGRLSLAVVCGVLAVILALEAGAEERDAIWGRGAGAAMASRMAWPSVWNDRGYWSEELRELTSEEELWQATYCPGNMEIVLEAIEERAGDGAQEAYREMAQTAWRLRRPMILRQIAWDALGYAAFPLIFPIQLEGRMYDSYTGRNYEVMREHAPALTGHYVRYCCWWFACCLGLAALLSLVRLLQGGIGRPQILGAGLCALIGALLSLAYTMRGAGLMDYRCTVALSQLWLAWAVLGAGGAVDGSGAGGA